jgi:Na+-transporting NADH:ubiquinone oxidoreductase subunit NqrC
MLTATYSLLAIQFEQKNACTILARLRYHLHAIQREKNCLDQPELMLMINQLQQFDQYLHGRKIERHVIPVLCCATDEADLLVEELEMLSLTARRGLTKLQHYLHQCASGGDYRPIFLAAEHYCESMAQRLEKEDESLMYLVIEVLTREDWFALGARFLTEDGEKYTSRSSLPSPVQLTAVISSESTATN